MIIIIDRRRSKIARLLKNEYESIDWLIVHSNVA